MNTETLADLVRPTPSTPSWPGRHFRRVPPPSRSTAGRCGMAGSPTTRPSPKRLALGADRVFVLPAGVACALDQPPRGVLASALHALSVLIEQRLIVEVAYLADRVALHVLPPLCPLGVASFDFRHGAELIDRARRATRAWLAEGGTRRPRPERFLSLHHHRSVACGVEQSSLLNQYDLF